MNLSRKHTRLLDAIFSVPTRANIKFANIEQLLLAIGAEKYEGRGSRVAFVMPNGLKWEAHRPHPQKEARKYQIESLREFLQRLEIGNE
jgi:hypothetical protein